MESIKVRQHVGKDGILHLDLPVGATELDLEVVVIYQPVQSLIIGDRSSLANLYGICVDDPISINREEISESLDDELVGAFD